MRSRLALVLGGALLGLSVGCEAPVIDSGKDIAYLAEPQEPADASSEPILPLAAGNTWVMDVASTKARAEDQLRVVGPIALGRESGTLIEVRRGGQIWRREAYRVEKEGVSLLGFGEGQQPLLTLEPPLRLYRLPVKVGTYSSWDGMIQIKNRRYSAVGFSRTSSRDDLTTTAGRFVTYRIDTVISIRNTSKPTHFPTIRWLAPGIGFVKRGYADGGNPALAELKRFSVH